MARRWLFVPAVVLVVAAQPATTLAQDELASIMRKRRIDDRDRALIEAEVDQRAQRLANAGKERDRRNTAREKILRSARLSGVTGPALDAYAAACAKKLSGLTTSKSFENSYDAVTLLVELDNVNTAGALADALKSSHAATRYHAALGLTRLHQAMAKDERACRRILRALGKAGAEEKQGLILKVIYEAVDFNPGRQNPRLADGCADALGAVFEKRVAALEAGRRDEMLDRRGYQAAIGCYAAASDDRKAQLIGHMARFLAHGVRRYIEPDTSSGYRPKLAGLIKAAEDTVHGMIRASNKRPPSNRVSAALKGRPPTPRTERAAQDALADLTTLLKGDPWNLP